MIRAQQDLDFALRLLDRESRQDAFGELGLDLTDEEANSLHERLDAIARLSFQDAMQMLRTAGVGILM